MENKKRDNMIIKTKKSISLTNSPKNIELSSKVIDIDSEFILSNCLSEITKYPDNASDIFYKNVISNKTFSQDPWNVINNLNIVLKYKEDIYPIKVGIPFLLSKLLFKSDLPEETLNKLYVNKSYFGIKSNNLEPELKKINLKTNMKIKNFDNITINQINELDHDYNKKHTLKKCDIPTNKIKSITPSTEQLKLLNLNKGRNVIKFICKSRLSGQQELNSEIYLWDKQDRIVISDVDGTITKSDVLGHLMPIFGNDWAQPGVTELFNSIDMNGYKIIYLTARAICQSTVTKNYLNNLNQNNYKLPSGPLVMSPDGLFTSFKREVIDKTPQVN